MRKILVCFLLVILATAPLTAASSDWWTALFGNYGSSENSSGNGTSEEPSSYNADSENTSTSSAAVRMKLTAGGGSGVYIGFSSTPYEKTSDGTVTSAVTPVQTGVLTVATPAEMGEITASGCWYAYWVIRNLENSMSLNLSWSSDAVDADGNELFSIYKDSDYKSSVDSPLESFTITGTSYAGTYPLYIKTADLRDWYYDVEYKLVLTLEVLSN